MGRVGRTGESGVHLVAQERMLRVADGLHQLMPLRQSPAPPPSGESSGDWERQSSQGFGGF